MLGSQTSDSLTGFSEKLSKSIFLNRTFIMNFFLLIHLFISALLAQLLVLDEF